MTQVQDEAVPSLTVSGLGQEGGQKLISQELLDDVFVSRPHSHPGILLNQLRHQGLDQILTGYWERQGVLSRDGGKSLSIGSPRSRSRDKESNTSSLYES